MTEEAARYRKIMNEWSLDPSDTVAIITVFNLGAALILYVGCIVQWVCDIDSDW